MKNQNVRVLIVCVSIFVFFAVSNAAEVDASHPPIRSADNLQSTSATSKESDIDPFLMHGLNMHDMENVIKHQPQSFTNDLQSHFVRLKTIAENPATNKHVRINAILDIGVLDLTNAVSYLFENIDVKIETLFNYSDDLGMRTYPYFYALVKKRKAVIPDVMAYLDTPRNSRDLEAIFDLLTRVFYSEDGTVDCFLLKQREEALLLPDAKTRMENINKLLIIHSQKKIE
jgi:hypothetical protein